jgi:hypothetical protein
MMLRAALLGAPLLLFAGDALAWGLQTHLFFAQQALFLLPLADAEFRRAIARLPRLVLAGACLPDLALAGRMLGIPVFRSCHGWPMLRRFAAAASDEERAVALGYASHLLADIVAHNEFVPEHERRIAPVAHLTHALCEWAMDDYLRSAVFASPGDVLEAEQRALAEIAASRMRCDAALVRRALELLARADRALRRSRLPRLCRAVARRFDPLSAPRFEAYARETAVRLGQVWAALEGKLPDGEPEPRAPAAPAFRVRGRLSRPPSLV